MIYEELWKYQYTEKRLISGFIEESTETFIIEDVEFFGEDTSTTDFMVWNGKPTILYRYAYYDENNIGIAIYNNSQFDCFEAVNVDNEEYIELLACNDVLYILYNSASEHLEISEIEFNYQDMSWQKVNKKTISQGELRSGTVRDVENSENKELIVSNYKQSNGYYNEEFDMRQLSGYIIKITLFLLVLVIPIAYNKFRKNKKKEMKS
ncbi:MAG: hypothetical protein KGD64_15145 [Candidatus Heimdallarchaeota archaeon]|nr:hypothetical protein [Candidatus Heimdallarchaeota archaeon]